MPDENEQSDGEQTAPDQSDVQGTDDSGESAELDIASLPDKAQTYIHELREESKSRRLEHEQFKKVFDTFTPDETEYLLDIIAPLGGDDDSMKIGAEKLRGLADQILGPLDEPAPAEDKPSMGVETEDKLSSGLTESEIRDIVSGQTQQDKDIARIHKQTEDLGFELGTDGQKALWDLAVSPAINGDLTKAAAALDAIYPELMPDGYGDSSDEQAPEAEAEEDKPSRFPASAPASGAGKTAEPKEETSIPKLGSDELRARVRARMDAVPGE